MGTTNKKQARILADEAIRALSGELRIVLDAQIATHVTHLPFWHEAQTVFGYLAMEDEVDLHAVLRSAYRGGKTIALPRVEDSGIEFRAVAKREYDLATSLERHPFGFLQPKSASPRVIADERTLILVPGRGFDRSGARLGRGGGYYDRFLSALDPTITTVGIAYSVQVVRSVPHDESDVPVQIVLTDGETCFCRRSA